TRYEIEAERAEVLDGRRRRQHALAADRLRPTALGAPDQDRHVAARSVQVRLHDLEHETRGDRRVEGVAAALEDAHAGGGSQPMRRGNRAEGAAKLRPCGEHQAHAPVKVQNASQAASGAAMPPNHLPFAFATPIPYLLT